MRNCFRYIATAVVLCVHATLSWTSPVTDLLERVDRGASRKITVQIVDDGSGTDYFELSQRGNKPCVKGNNYVSVATGLNWYLKYYCGVHLSWNNITQTAYKGGYVQLPRVLPRVTATERHATGLTRRYALNYCTFSYSMAFWDWQRWQQEIDLMALHGINMPLAIVGLDVVWKNVLTRYGYSKAEVNAFIAGPAFQAWWAMANLEGWGGPNGDEWYEQRAELQKKILRRMRELGMEPVLPGYLGMVPHDAKERLGLNVDDAGLWNGFPRPANLSPKDSRFVEVAKVYYEELTRLCGKSRYYSMDPFHEGGSDERTDYAGAARAIYDAMKACNKDAVWVIQGWGQNPREAVLDAMPKGDILILDLFSTAEPHWTGTGVTTGQSAKPTNEELSLGENANDVGFKGHDWLFCMLDNFGGRVGLNGHLPSAIDGLEQAKQVEKENLRGIGFTMEAIENNPLCFELMSELPWRAERVDVDAWIADYCEARYGVADSSLVAAWQLLAHTVLSCPYPMHGPQESLFCARPSKDLHQASETGRTRPYYDPEASQCAERLLRLGGTAIAGSYGSYSIQRDNYEYDLVDVSRQARADRGRIAYNRAMADYKSFDRKSFAQNASQFLSLLLEQDSLLSTRPEFTLERWIGMARRLAGDNELEANRMEWNARVQITTWGTRVTADDGNLHEYANKEWSGILRTLYYDRWKRFFDMLTASLNGEPEQQIDFYPMEEAWTRSGQ